MNDRIATRDGGQRDESLIQDGAHRDDAVIVSVSRKPLTTSQVEAGHGVVRTRDGFAAD